MVWEHYLSIVFYFCLSFKLITQLYLSWRNQRHIMAHRQSVPPLFQEQIPLPDHHKAADYSAAKAKIGRIQLIFETLLLLVWLPLGGLVWLEDFFSHFSPLISGVLFLLSFGIINSALHLPFSLYSTFKIEEEFGFNKMTPSLFIKDLFKQFILSLILGVPVLFFILWAMSSTGDLWWLYAFFGLTAFQLLLVIIYPTWLAPLFNKFEKLQDGEIRDQVVELLKKIDFPYSELFVMDASTRSSHGNAYFTGLGKFKRIVLFDTLLKQINPQEVQAVLAHEIGHFKLNHIKKGLIRGILSSLVAMAVLGLCMRWPLFFTDHGVVKMNNHLGLALFMMVVPIYSFFLTPLSSWWSRKYEYQADDFAAQYAPAKNLISALVKMYRDNAGPVSVDPLFSKFYYSHPPPLERIHNLAKY